jgi:hypothetical protein
MAENERYAIFRNLYIRGVGNDEGGVPWNAQRGREHGYMSMRTRFGVLRNAGIGPVAVYMPVDVYMPVAVYM